MTFWHTERLTKKHRSSGKITRASNRAIIDDLTVRDLEPYFGHTTSGEDTRPKGEPITYPWKIWKPRSERTPEVEGSGGKNRLPKTKGATSSTAGRRSKIFKKSRRVVPKEKPRGGEPRIEKKAILLPSPAQQQQQQQQPQRRKIRSRRSAQQRVETGGRSRHGAEIQKKEGKCPHAAVLLRGTLSGKFAKWNLRDTARRVVLCRRRGSCGRGNRTEGTRVESRMHATGAEWWTVTVQSWRSIPADSRQINRLLRE